MATVQVILSRKGRDVVTIEPSDTALRAAELMNERGIGGLVVIEAGRMVGILTERDILRRVVAARRDPEETMVRDVMTAAVASCRPETALAECRSFMTDKRIRHLPVVDDRGLCGIVTIGDLMAEEAGEHEATIQYLNDYIHGRP